MRAVKKVLPKTTMGFKPLASMERREATIAITRMIRDGVIDAVRGGKALRMLGKGLLVLDVVNFLFETESAGGGPSDIRAIYFFGHGPEYVGGDHMTNPRMAERKGFRVFQGLYLDVSKYRWTEGMNQIFVSKAIAEVFNGTGDIALQTNVWDIRPDSQYWKEMKQMMGAGLVPYYRQMVPGASLEGQSVLRDWEQHPWLIPPVAR
jgi:hypothetical protein